MMPANKDRIKTWVIGILLALVIFVAIGLLTLSMLGGTSETHRQGLEQAFSDFLKADVQLGSLDQFNIVPQLSLKTGQIRGRFRDNGDEFMMDRFDLAFGFSDLLAGNQRIENIAIENLRFAKEASRDLKIENLKIDPALSLLTAQGQYRQKPFSIALDLEVEKGVRPSYSIGQTASLSGKLNSLRFEGEMVQVGKNQRLVRDIKIFSGDKLIMTGKSKAQDHASSPVRLLCQPGQSLSKTEREDIAVLKQSGFVEAEGPCLK